MSRLKFVLFTIVCIITQFSTYSQCAMCKAAVESVEDEGGYNDAILYLMMFPYIIGAVVLFVFLHNRKKLKLEEEKEINS